MNSTLAPPRRLKRHAQLTTYRAFDIWQVHGSAMSRLVSTIVAAASLFWPLGLKAGEPINLPKPGDSIQELYGRVGEEWIEVDDEKPLEEGYDGYDNRVLEYELRIGRNTFAVWVTARNGQVSDHGFMLTSATDLEESLEESECDSAFYGLYSLLEGIHGKSDHEPKTSWSSKSKKVTYTSFSFPDGSQLGVKEEYLHFSAIDFNLCDVSASYVTMYWPLPSKPDSAEDVNAPRASATSTESNIPPPPPPKPERQVTQKWEFRTKISPIDDSTNVYLSVEADKPISGWVTRLVTPILILRCKENKTTAYVNAFMRFQNIRGETDKVDVTLRFDKEDAFGENFFESTDGKGLFFPHPIRYIRKMVGHKKMLFRFTPFNANPVTTTFDLSGLPDAIKPLQEVCNWEDMDETVAARPNLFGSVLKNLAATPSKPRAVVPPKAREEPEMPAKRVLSPAERRQAIGVANAVRQQVEQNWDVPAGARDARKLEVEIHIVLRPDGTVVDARIVDSARLRRAGEEFFRTMAESAVRAVWRASPLRDLPPRLYDKWREITLTFIPPE